MSQILTLNAGSSSLKFGVYGAEPGADPVERLHGQIDGVATETPKLKMTALDPALKAPESPQPVAANDHAAALASILEALAEIGAIDPAHPPSAVGHRIVHGGVRYGAPVALNHDILDELATLSPFAPLHQPHNLAGVRAAEAAFPNALQVGCFDTAFHRGHPFVNDVFALPRRYYEKGVRRYGFHGLSYDYLSHRLVEIAPELAEARVVIAHLGNGASMCALKAGRSVGSTMGFSALDGLPMGTRCGQLDPGVLLYLMEEEGLSAGEITTLLYKESGLKGLSALSHDMRTLEASETSEAREAIDYYVFRIRRELGAMAAVLGGVDALVFSGGVGEHSVTVRGRVCEGMEWLRLALDPAKNAGPMKSREVELTGAGSEVRIFRIITDEERMIARAAAAALEGRG